MSAVTATKFETEHKGFAGMESEARSGEIRILMVDDHPIVRQGLRMAVSREVDLDVCGEADGESDALQKFRELVPDVVIVDMSLNEGTGLELIKELKSQRHDVKVLVWSMHDESLFAERAVRAGALGYVNKAESTSQMVQAIRRVASGKVYLSERMTNRMLCRTMGAGNGDQRTPMETLSDRELEVFEEIGRGVTTRQIAEKLALSPKTVETYRENIKAKLDLANATQLTQHAVQWVLENS